MNPKTALSLMLAADAQMRLDPVPDTKRSA
jgi:hypothetical protein